MTGDDDTLTYQLPGASERERMYGTLAHGELEPLPEPEPVPVPWSFEVQVARANLYAQVRLAEQRGQAALLDAYLEATRYELPRQVEALLEEAAAGTPGAGDAYLEATKASRDRRHQRKHRAHCALVTDAADLTLGDLTGGV